MRSLRGRLTLGVVAVLAVVLAVAGALTLRYVDETDRDSVDDRLGRTAELLRATARQALQTELPEDDQRLDNVLAASGSSLRLTLGRFVLRAGGA